MYCTRRSIPARSARRQEHRLVDAETAVLSSAHVLDDFRLDLVLGQIKGKDRFLPGVPPVAPGRARAVSQIPPQG